MDTYIERKQELLPHQKRCSSRSWRNFYAILSGQLMSFYKDQQDFLDSKLPATSPINVFSSTVSIASDYVKRKNVFRLKCFDGSEFLFAVENEVVMGKWVEVLGRVAMEDKDMTLDDKCHEADVDLSSDEELKPRSREPLYANVASKIGSSLEEERMLRQKPPIPPRSSSIKLDEIDGHKTLPTKQEVQLPRSSGSLPSNRPHNDHSSSESDSPKSGKNSKRSSTGLMGLFKRKKATQL